MDETQRPLGAVENNHVLTTNGWIALGSKVNGSVMTPGGWVIDQGDDDSRVGASIAIMVAALVLAGLGVVMANAPVSLLSGTGTNWTGAAIAIVAIVGGTVGLIALKAPLWATLVTGVVGGLMVLLSVGSVVYYEVQLQDRRESFLDNRP